MTNWDMNCTECGREIKRGEDYTALLRQTERVGRFGAVSIRETKSERYYHPACAPQDRAS